MLSPAMEEHELGWTAPSTAEMAAMASVLVAGLEQAAASQDGHGAELVYGGHGGQSEAWAELAGRLVAGAHADPQLVAQGAGPGGRRGGVSPPPAPLAAGGGPQRHLGPRVAGL